MKKINLLFSALAILLLISCNKAQNNELIIGAWEANSIEFIDASIEDEESIRMLNKFNENKNFGHYSKFCFSSDNRFRMYHKDGVEVGKNKKPIIKYRIINEEDFDEYPNFTNENENGNLIALISIKSNGDPYEGTNIVGPFEIILLSKNELCIIEQNAKFFRKDTVSKPNSYIKYKRLKEPKKKSKSKKGELTDELAKETVRKLLDRGDDLPDNERNARLIEWRGLFEISENEMYAKAIVKQKYKMSGQFIFRKNTSNEWVLIKVDFSTDSGYIYWKQEVFQKVE